MRNKSIHRLFAYVFFSVVLLLSCADNCHAGFFTGTVNNKEAAIQQPLPGYLANIAQHNAPYPRLHRVNNAAPDGAVKDDSYKGIVALVAGSTGLALILMALLLTSVGLLFPAFLLGLAGIIFGALPKRSRKKEGRIGLILGAVTVFVILAFVGLVIVALSSFT